MVKRDPDGTSITSKKIEHILRTRHPRQRRAWSGILLYLASEFALKEMYDNPFDSDVIYKQMSALIFAALARMSQSNEILIKASLAMYSGDRAQVREVIRQIDQKIDFDENPFEVAMEELQKVGLTKRIYCELCQREHNLLVHEIERYRETNEAHR